MPYDFLFNYVQYGNLESTMFSMTYDGVLTSHNQFYQILYDIKLRPDMVLKICSKMTRKRNKQIFICFEILIALNYFKHIL